MRCKPFVPSETTGRSWSHVFSAAIALTGLLAAPATSQDIDTWTGGTPNPFNWFFGHATSSAWSVGQTFRVDAAAPDLTSFSFWLRSDDAPFAHEHVFRAFIAEWDPMLNSPGPLFSAPQLTPTFDYISEPVSGPGTTALERLDFSGFPAGAITLKPGAHYIAILSSGGLTNPRPGNAVGSRVAVMGDRYGDGGGFYLRDADPTVDDLTWTTISAQSDPSDDFAFAATFASGNTTVTPEPATFLLLGTGLAGLALMARRRRETEPGA